VETPQKKSEVSKSTASLMKIASYRKSEMWDGGGSSTKEIAAVLKRFRKTAKAQRDEITGPGHTPGSSGGTGDEFSKEEAVTTDRKEDGAADSNQMIRTLQEPPSPPSPSRSPSKWGVLRQKVKKKSTLRLSLSNFIRGMDPEDEGSKIEKLVFTDDIVSRLSLRLDGFESYSVLGALVMGFAFGCVSAVDTSEFERFPWVVGFSFTVISLITTFGSLYTMMIFALCSLYGKTGLGMQTKDGAYQMFIQRTAVYRHWAFHTFIVSLAGCGLLMMITLLLKVPVIHVILTLPLAGCCFFTACVNLKNVMAIATATIFAEDK
jgi:hypothetical protein